MDTTDPQQLRDDLDTLKKTVDEQTHNGMDGQQVDYNNLKNKPATTVKTLWPLPNYLTSGALQDNPGINANTLMYLGQLSIPFKITANSISLWCPATAVPGKAKLVLYSEDGQTQIFNALTANFVAGAVVTTALSGVVINPGVYWFGFLPIGAATDIQWMSYNTVATTNNLTWGVASKPTLQGFLTVTADTPPATFSPTGLSNSGASLAIFRLDN